MLNEIAKNIYLVEVPLPKNPLRALNCYFIKNGENILVIDSGFDHEESEKVFFDALDELGAKVGKTDMFFQLLLLILLRHQKILFHFLHGQNHYL